MKRIPTSGQTGQRASCFAVAMLILLSLRGSESLAAPKDKSNNKTAFRLHAIVSPYQKGETQIRVLLPDRIQKGRRYPVVYVLPVEAGASERWGDGLKEVRKADLHNRFQAVFVAPSFSHLPWFCDHPTDKTIRQESYLLKEVLPLIELNYPVEPTSSGRFLVGFSKSGWGAYSLLLRHPDVFAKAAAWDAPLMQDRPNKFGMGPIFGTQKNLERYRITTLLKKTDGAFRKKPRLILTGFGGFHDQHRQAHALMNQLGISHVYRDGPKRKHHWSSGWLTEAVELLLDKNPKPTVTKKPRKP